MEGESQNSPFRDVSIVLQNLTPEVLRRYETEGAIVSTVQGPSHVVSTNHPLQGTMMNSISPKPGPSTAQSPGRPHQVRI